MASYRVLIKPSAVKELEAAPPAVRRRLVARIRALASDPRPPGCEKLTGREQYRVRQGTWRILYTVDDDVVTVVVVKVGHRRDVYR